MASFPILTVVDKTRVSPPPGTIGDRSLPLTYFDLYWLTQPPVHYLFFYELSVTQTQFIETIIPNLKHSLSITLQHFFPFAGNLIVYPTSTKNPEIRFVEGDSVAVTFAECSLDFNQLTRNNPRACEMFYHLIPSLEHDNKASEFTKIDVFSVQVTLFPNFGISVGMTNHHCLGDAKTRFSFLKAWTSIARFGTNESFLANETLPSYDRVAPNPRLEEIFLKFAKVEKFKEEYQPQKLCGPTDKVRATFILTRTALNKLKNLVTTQLPTSYVSSFTVACGYIWSCIAETRNDGLQWFGFTIDCRARVNPPLPIAYFGNCLTACMALENTANLTGKEGFVNAAKMIGESLQKSLSDIDGFFMKIESLLDMSSNNEIPTTAIGVAGTPKLKFYDIDFGWGKPKKIETISIDYTGSISMNACKENHDDFEIGVCLLSNEIESFVRIFEDGLQKYI
uniref:Anthocyanidin 3-O-glucoside 6''-O-acyltransferase n=1 Tax=Zinnia elegans TaxID=34245 RepID=A0A8K1JX20_ZINEL|nr:anthocyanidin 3-O-glucoside 6''-O-acyltransferase [Zinnia elegans]